MNVNPRGDRKYPGLKRLRVPGAKHYQEPPTKGSKTQRRKAGRK